MRLLALQRLVGNRAATALIARQQPGPKPKDPSLAAGEIEVKGGAPTPKGSWSMTPAVRGGKLYLEGPLVEFEAKLSVLDKTRKFPSTTVGFVQTVKSADRQGIYTSDGTPSGTPIVTTHLSVPKEKNMRDVKTDFVADPTQPGGIKLDPSGAKVQYEKAPPPFYDNPSYLDTAKDDLKLGRPSTMVTTEDQTRTNFPLDTTYFGKSGKLAATSGADRFRTAVVAKEGDAPPIFLASEDWDVPWESQIDPATHKVAKTGAVWIHPSDVPLGHQKEPKGAVNKEAIDWSAVRTVADAKALGAQQCLGLLLLAREFDPQSYEAMATALRELNPVLAADVSVAKGGIEQLTLAADGVRGTQTRATNTPGIAVWHLLDFFDPNDLKQGTAIKLSVAGTAGSGQIAWSFPFAGASLSVGSVTVSFRLGGTTMAPTAPVPGPVLAPPGQGPPAGH